MLSFFCSIRCFLPPKGGFFLSEKNVVAVDIKYVTKKVNQLIETAIGEKMRKTYYM